MLNKTDHHKVVAQGFSKTTTTHLYILRSSNYKWLYILNYIRIQQTASFWVGTTHKKFWEKND